MHILVCAFVCVISLCVVHLYDVREVACYVDCRRNVDDVMRMLQLQ